MHHCMRLLMSDLRNLSTSDLPDASSAGDSSAGQQLSDSPFPAPGEQNLHPNTAVGRRRNPGRFSSELIPDFCPSQAALLIRYTRIQYRLAPPA